MRHDIPGYSYRLFWSEEDDCYVAVCPELPHLSGLGDTADNALDELSVAIGAAIESLQAEGCDAPVPASLPGYSGQFRLRLPRTLHAQLAARAELEGVSLNTLAVAVLSRGLAEATGITNQRANNIMQQRPEAVR
ncbi:type II toxin-antitoxin system HicB family antitoxin [Gemmatimonadota bacterium]